MLALPLVFVPSFLVGHFAAREDTGWFDWELAAIFGTALGTTALAGATGALAYETSDELRVTRGLGQLTKEQVEIERRALQASVRPRMANAIDSAIRFDVPEPARGIHGEVRVGARNVGVGVAMIQGATMYWNSPGEADPTSYVGTLSNKVVPPKETTSANFWFPESDARPRRVQEEQRKFWVEISYTDSANEQAEIARIDVAFNGGWAISDVSFRLPGDATPYASTQPG